jgi:hypothetical protein
MCALIKEILFADTHNYHGKVDHRFIDLATQFSRLQDARSHQGGAALVVYFQGQKVVDIFTGKNLKNKIGNLILWQCVIRQVKEF